MKKILFLMTALSLIVVPSVRAQDAAVEERLNKLSGHIEDLLRAQAEQQKRIAALAKDFEGLREQASKPTGNFASQEELRKLAEKLQEIDDRRVADNEKIVKEIEKNWKASSGSRTERIPSRGKAESAEKPGSSGGPEEGFYYVIQSDDTLSAISIAYRKKGINVTVDQILKANHGLEARNLQPGQKIFIPKPAQ